MGSGHGGGGCGDVVVVVLFVEVGNGFFDVKVFEWAGGGNLL